MSGTTITVSTSVVLVPTSSNYTRPFIVRFPNISTVGRIITVRDNDGFASTGNTIVLSTLAGATFSGVTGPITINQPYGFITLASQANGNYAVLNTFAFPAGQAAANVSNLTAQNVLAQSTLQMIDYGNQSTNTIYTSSGQFIFNGNFIGQITSNQLASTVVNLGTTGYLSTIPEVFVVPPTWITVGQSSTISAATSTGSIQISINAQDWGNVVGGKGFAKFGTAAAYGEGYYIAVGNNNDGVTASNLGYNQWSFNGTDWYTSYAPYLSSTQARTACLYANGLFHSVGSNGGVGGASTILWSDDAKVWNPSRSNPFVANDGTGYATGIAFGAGLWVCSGIQNTQSPGYNLLWSRDGSNWSPAATVPFSFGGVLDVAYDGIRFVALCLNGTNASGSNVCRSTDGSNWTSAGVTGGNFANLPRYVTGCNSAWVATTGNSNQSLVYSLDGGLSWQSNTNLSGSNVPIFKPYYDGQKWWVGVQTANNSESIYYATQTAPGLQTWNTSNIISGFRNGGVARAFVSTDGQSNVTTILNSTIFGLGVNFGTSNLNASTISVGTAFVGELNASSLFIGVTFVSTTNETITNISTQNVNFMSAGTIVSSRNFMDSLSVNRASVGQAVVGQLGVNISNPQYQLHVDGNTYIDGTLFVGETNPLVSSVLRFTTNNGVSYIQSGSNLSGNSGNELRFARINDTVPAMTVNTSTFRVGINRTDPKHRLHVNGDAGISKVGEQGLLLFKAEGGNSFIQSGSNKDTEKANKLFFTSIDDGTRTMTVDMFNTRVGINTTTPSYELEANGSVWARSTLYVGSNTSTNQIRFYGTSGDDQTKFTHTVIGEYLYGHSEQSELILFKGDNATLSGPDRVRVLAAGGFRVDTGGAMAWSEGAAPPTATYSNALFVSGQNGFVGVGTSTPTVALDVAGNLNVSGTITGTASVFVTGMLMIWTTSSAPTGWLICNGAAVSRTTYAALFALISSTYGNGDGVNTFNLPNLSQRFPLGAGGSYTLAQTGGSMTQTLTSNQLPAHSHGITDPGHSHSITPVVGTTGFPLTGGGTARAWVAQDGRLNDLTAVTNTTNITINNAGGGQAFNIINSYLAINYIIKF